MLPQEGPFLGVLLVKLLVAWQEILKTKVFSQQKGQIKGGRGNVLLFCSFCGSERGKRLFESFAPEYSGQMFTTEAVGENWSIGSEMFLFPKERPGKKLEFQRKT